MKKAILMTVFFFLVLWTTMFVFKVFEPAIVGRITANQAKDTMEAMATFRFLQIVPRLIYTVFALALSFVWIHYIVKLTKGNNQNSK